MPFVPKRKWKLFAPSKNRIEIMEQLPGYQQQVFSLIGSELPLVQIVDPDPVQSVRVFKDVKELLAFLQIRESILGQMLGSLTVA